jgi:hypothetical protein
MRVGDLRAYAAGSAMDASVDIGPPMSPDEEREHRERLRAVALEEAEKAVAAIGAKVSGIDLAQVEDSAAAARKLEGMRQSLAAAREELARLRAEDGDN